MLKQRIHSIVTLCTRFRRPNAVIRYVVAHYDLPVYQAGERVYLDDDGVAALGAALADYEARINFRPRSPVPPRVPAGAEAAPVKV